jgi:hypothetical protein
MSYYEDNPYYTDGALGLHKLAEINDPNECWSFDDFVLWQHEDGTLYWGSDSGCSCPSPFEDVNSLDDLNHLTNDDPEAWNKFQEAVEEHCWYSYTHSEGDVDPLAGEKTQLLAKAVSALGKRDMPTNDTVTLTLPRKAADVLYQAYLAYERPDPQDYSYKDAQEDLAAALDGALNA